jgi:chromosome segregation ATPase
MLASSGSVVLREWEETMDDNFTTGPKDDDKTTATTLHRMDRRIDTIAVDLRAMVLEHRELRVTLMELNRSIQRRTPELSADKQALLDLRRDYANIWEMYANAQKRIDRLEARVEELERKLEPPLPPFPELMPRS